MSDPHRPTALRSFGILFGFQALIALFYFSWTLVGFIGVAEGQSETFTQVAVEQYLGTIIVYQLRVIPAYLMLALALTLILFPFLSRWTRLGRVTAGGGQRGDKPKVLLGLMGLDLGMYVLSLGVFFRKNPGLMDGMARKTSHWTGLDYYDLYRYRILDGLEWLFWAVCALSAAWYVRAWFGRFRQARPALKLAWSTPLLAIVWGISRFGSPPTPPPASPDTPMNVLVIAADSLRYDRLGVHGYHRGDISPNIDAFARDAADFRQLHVATASTIESWFSSLSGRFPPSHGVRYMYLRKPQVEAANAVPDLISKKLRHRGYRTSVVSDWAGNCFKLVDMGFEHTLTSDTQSFKALVLETIVWSHLIFPLYFSNELGQFLLPEVERVTKYIRPAALTEKMIGEIDAATRSKDPFFGVLFYSTTHLPYSVGYPFNLKYVDPDYDGPHRYEIEVKVDSLIKSGFDTDLPPAVIGQINNLYDGAVSEFDHHVGTVIDALKARGLYDRTIIIVTSDHGEDLYEEGSSLGHGTNFFGGDQSTRIPFIIRVPGVTQPGQTIDALARNIDIAPTLAALTDTPPSADWEGVDLSPLIRGTASDLDLPIFAETCYLFFPKTVMSGFSQTERDRLYTVDGASETLTVDPDFDDNMVLKERFHAGAIRAKDRMVRTRRWKLIHIPGKDAPIYRLYDLAADPHQKVDLAAEAPPVMNTLIEYVDAYWKGDAGPLRWPNTWEPAGEPTVGESATEGPSPPR